MNFLKTLWMRLFYCSDYPKCEWGKWGNETAWYSWENHIVNRTKDNGSYGYTTQERTCKYCGKKEQREI